MSECPFPENAAEIKALLIIKPSHLFHKGNYEQKARRVFSRCDVICPRDIDHMDKIVERAAGNYDLVLAGGGDGTLNRIIQKLDRERLGVGVIVLGSGNDFARNFVKASGTAAKFLTLKVGSWRKVDLLKAGSILYHNSGGLGIDTATLYTREQATSALSRNYGIAFLRTIPWLKPIECELALDGRDMSDRYLWILAMNNQWIGGGMLAAPRAKLDDGLLDVLLIKNIPKWKLAFLLPQIYSGQHINNPAVIYEQGTELKVKCDKPIARIALDGELYYTRAKTITFSVLEKAMWVFGKFKR